MRQFEIWSEGYVTTGQEATAHFHGYQEAKTFKEACKRFFKDDNLYDDKANTYWACRLYDNESNARQYFG